jgi:hypothetical protein
LEDTCIKEKCLLWGLTDKNCPNFIESWWKPGGITSSPPKLVCDCAPKRTFMMIQELCNRLIGVEQTQEKMMNENVWVQVVAEVMGKATGINLEQFVNERQRLMHIENIKSNLLEEK